MFRVTKVVRHFLALILFAATAPVDIRTLRSSHKLGKPTKSDWDLDHNEAEDALDT